MTNYFYLIIPALSIILIVIIYFYGRTIFDFIVKSFFTLLFNKNEATTVLLAIDSKAHTRKYWYLNNIITPIIILYLPYVLTLVSRDFGTIIFNKTMVQLTLTGAFSMIAINIMRTNLTLVNESLKKSADLDDTIFEGLLKDTESIKSKLRSWIHLMTLLGSIAFFLQAGNLIKSDSPNVTYYVFIIFVIFISSIFFGRLIYVLQTNFIDDDAIVRSWVLSLKRNQKTEYSDLKADTEQGIL